MSDIIERMHRVYREACADWDTVPSGLTDVLLDAKVEIERLRAILRDIERALATFTVESEP